MSCHYQRQFWWFVLASAFFWGLVAIGSLGVLSSLALAVGLLRATIS